MIDEQVQIIPEQEETPFEIKTVCGECVFSIYNEDNTNQIGCTLGRLSKYVSKNKALYKEKDGLWSFEIQTLCNTCRNAEWAQNVSNPIDKVKKEIRVRLDYIIPIDSSNNLIYRLNRTLASIKKQLYKPSCIHIGLNTLKLSKTDIKNIRLTVVKECAEYIYNITNLTNLNTSTRDIIDTVQTKCKGQYYTVIEHGDTLPTTWSESIENLVNEKLENFSIIMPINYNLTGMTVQNSLHRLLVGSKGQLIEDKIKILATDQGSLHMIKTWDEIKC